MMGLKPDENNYDNQEFTDCMENNSYIVETLIAPENVKAIFSNQEVTIPTQILTDNNR